MSWCCNIASKADLSVTVENDVLIQAQLDTLFDSFDVLANVTREHSIQWVEFAKSVHSKFQEIDDNLTNILNSKDIMVDWFSHVTLRSVSSLTEMIVKLLMAEKLDQIYMACTQNQIPLSVITPEMLQNEVNNINKQLWPRAEIAIPSISALYKLNIVNCVFNDNMLEVFIKFPVTNIGKHWKVVDVIPTPFAYKKHVCKLLPEPAMFLTNDTHIRLLTPKQRERCLDNNICAIPRETKYVPSLDQCIENLYLGKINNYDVLGEFCKFHCTPYSGPEVLDLELNNYIVVHSKHNLIVQCKNEMLPLSADPVGSSHINVPCACTLKYKNVLLIEEQYPCDPRLSNKFNKTVVLPELWSKLDRNSALKNFNYEYLDALVPTLISKNLSFVMPEFAIVPSMKDTSRQKVSPVIYSHSNGVYAFCIVLLALQILLFIMMAVVLKCKCCGMFGCCLKESGTTKASNNSSDIELNTFRRATARM